MRVLILADVDVAEREGELLARLAVGLAAEGIRVVRAEPAPLLDAAAASIYAPRIAYEPPASFFSRRLAAGRIADALTDLDSGAPSSSTRAAAAGDEASEPPLHVVHAMGRSGWALAADLAHRCAADLVLDVFDAADASAALDAASRWSASIIAADPAIERSVAALDSSAPIISAPWGVHLAADDEAAAPPPASEPTRSLVLDPRFPSVADPEAAPTEPDPPDDARSAWVVVIADASRPADLIPCLDGLRIVRDEGAAAGRDLLAFFDAGLAQRTRLAELVQARGLAGAVSLIPRLESWRGPILRADALLVTDPAPRLRSIVLDAMAHSVLIVQAAAHPSDPGDPREPPGTGLRSTATTRLDPLRPGVTCLSAGSAAEWANAIRAAISPPSHANPVRHAARNYVREHRVAASHVRSLLAAYDRIAARPKRLK